MSLSIAESDEGCEGLPALRAALEAASEHEPAVEYDRAHRLLAEDNFVPCASEGFFYGLHPADYDLFRLDRGKIVEHRDTVEAIPPRSEWKNDNGRF